MTCSKCLWFRQKRFAAAHQMRKGDNRVKSLESICSVRQISHHPSINFHLYMFWLCRQKPEQRGPDLPLPSLLLLQGATKLFWRNTKVFPAQPRYMIPPACPGSDRGPSSSWTCLEVSGGHLNEVSKLPKLIPFNV